MTRWTLAALLLVAACQDGRPTINSTYVTTSSEAVAERPLDTLGDSAADSKNGPILDRPVDSYADETPRGEIVEPEAVAEAIDQAGAELEGPPGGELRGELVPPSQMDMETVEFTAAFRKACQWFRYWLDGIAIGDNQAVELATPILAEIPTWPVMAGMEEFWEMFLDNLDEGVSDGPQWFVDANCPEVRYELPAPSTPPVHNASAAVILKPDESPLVEPGQRAAAIERLGAELPLPPNASFGGLIDATHSESENSLTGVLAHHAWCHWLGAMLDGTEQRNDSATNDPLGHLIGISQSEQIAKNGYPVRDLFALQVIEGAQDGSYYWATADYQLNCFGIDTARDQRLNEQ